MVGIEIDTYQIPASSISSQTISGIPVNSRIQPIRKISEPRKHIDLVYGTTKSKPATLK